MKKYTAPAMETLSFGVNESIAGVILSSDIYNNFEYGQDTW